MRDPLPLPAAPVALSVWAGQWPCLAPGLSANGAIAFVSGRDGNAEIYVMGADGGSLSRLTTEQAFDTEPEW